MSEEPADSRAGIPASGTPGGESRPSGAADGAKPKPKIRLGSWANQPESPVSSRAAAAAARRKRIEERVARRRRDVLRLLATVFAAVAAVAMLADCHGVMTRIRKAQEPGGAHVAGDAKSIRENLGKLAVYEDPGGLFSIGVPPNWRKLRPDPESIFQVCFRGPYDMEMRVQCVVTNGLTFEKLVERLRQVERSMAANSHIGVAKMNDWRVATRYTQLWQTKTMYLDFVTGDLAHHLQFVIPTALYDEYAPVFMDLVRETYKPGQIIRLGEPPPAGN